MKPPTLEAARELLKAVKPQLDRIDAERVTLAWKSPVHLECDESGPLFNRQANLFDGEETQ